MAKDFWKNSMEKEQKRIYEQMQKVDPGSKEYRELQTQLGAYEIMSEKRRSGKLTAKDWLQFGATLTGTGLIIFADQLIPMAAQKLKLQEFATKIFKIK